MPLAVLAAMLAVAALVTLVRRVVAGGPQIDGVTVRTPTDDTRIDEDGAVRSIQGADIQMPRELLAELWTPETLERLARTYWAFLSTVTLGVIRVYYTERERYVCLLHPSLKLLTFQAPEYETSAQRGIVRWRIEKGLLVSRHGHRADGYLEIDVRLLDCDAPDEARINVEVEVANFYPAIATGLGRFLYKNTQSRIHVVVTHGFLRRLAHRELEQSVAGRFRAPSAAEIGEPHREREVGVRAPARGDSPPSGDYP
jgi:hypothetical protein